MPAVRETTALSYRQREEDGIHEFILLAPTRAAIDDLFAIYEGINPTLTEDEVILALIDISHLSGLPPLAYMMQRTREYERDNGTPVKTRTAVIYTSSVMIKIIETFISMMAMVRTSRAQVRFFKRDQHAAAVDWLLE